MRQLAAQAAPRPLRPSHTQRLWNEAICRACSRAAHTRSCATASPDAVHAATRDALAVRASARGRLTSAAHLGVAPASSMYRKFSAYDSRWLGCAAARPLARWYASAAIAGILPARARACPRQASGRRGAARTRAHAATAFAAGGNAARGALGDLRVLGWRAGQARWKRQPRTPVIATCADPARGARGRRVCTGGNSHAGRGARAQPAGPRGRPAPATCAPPRQARLRGAAGAHR